VRWGCWNHKTRLKSAAPAKLAGTAVTRLARAPIVRIGVAAIAGIALTACGGGSGGSPSITSSAPPQRGSLLQTPPQLVATYSTADLLAQLATSDLGKTLLDQISYSPLCAINVYHLEYETVDPSGALTPASGALMVPGGSSSCDGGRSIVLYAHATQTDRGFDIAQITAGDNDEGLLLAAVFAAKGYIVVAPNYVGYDTSTLGYHPYLVAQQQSDDMIDALTAARSALPAAAAPTTTDGGKLFITGYSQGGFVAMATHRAMQQLGMMVTAAAPLSGPYALSAFGDAIVGGQVSLSASINFAMVINSYQNAYSNVYSAADAVFNAPYASTVPDLLPSTTPVSELEADNKIPSSELFSSTPPAASYASITPATTPADLAPAFALGFGTEYLVTNTYRASYLEDAAASPDGGFPTLTNDEPPANPNNGLRMDLKTNDLRNWSPTSPVLLCAGNSDPTVFYLNTRLMQAYWTTNAPGAAVTLLDIDSAATANDPYDGLKHDFVIAKDLIIAEAIAGGATDGGALAVLEHYHAELVPPFCFSAAKDFFDGL
jgi:Prolyl oligopeptidase family